MSYSEDFMKPYIKNRLWLIVIAILLIFINKADFSEYALKVYSVLLPVIIALLFGWFLLPLKKIAENLFKKSEFPLLQKYSHPVSAFIVYVMFILAIVIFILCLIPIIRTSIENIGTQIEKYKSLTDGFIRSETINNIISKINPQIYINSAKVTVSALLNIVMSFAILIYILLEHKSLKKGFVNTLDFVIGEEKAEQSLYYISKVNIIFSKYFYSKFVSSAMLGVITALGFFAGGIFYPLLFGTIVALSNMIPVFGVIISTLPIAVLTFAEYGILKALISTAIIFVAQQIENNIITPKIVGDTVGLSGFWILVTTIAGGGLFGFWGLLICIPVAASFKMLFSEYKNIKK